MKFRTSQDLRGHCGVRYSVGAINDGIRLVPQPVRQQQHRDCCSSGPPLFTSKEPFDIWITKTTLDLLLFELEDSLPSSRFDFGKYVGNRPAD